jgi:hypothetical protein
MLHHVSDFPFSSALNLATTNSNISPREFRVLSLENLLMVMVGEQKMQILS